MHVFRLQYAQELSPALDVAFELLYDSATSFWALGFS